MKDVRRFEILDLYDKGVVVLDDNFNILHINHVFEEMFGIDKDGIKTLRDLHSYIHSGITNFEDCPFYQKIKAKEDKFAVIETLYSKSGGMKQYSIYLRIKKDLHFLFFSDITSDVNLDQNSMLLHQILENAIVVIVITDINGRIEYVNSSFEEITGYSSKEALGSTPSILKSGYHDDSFYRDLWDTIKSGRIWRGRFINKRKNGDIYYEKAIILPLKNLHGEIIKFAAIKEDITNELEMEKQLMRAQSMENIGKIVLPITHDMNNFITAMTINLENMEKNLNDREKLLELIKTQQNTLEKAKDFYRKLTNLGKKERINYIKFDLYEFMENNKNFWNSVVGNDISLQIENNSHLFVYGDPEELGQMMLNMIINAKDAIEEKFGRKTGGKIKISTESVIFNEDTTKYATPTHKVVVKKGDYASIVIEDNGIGIKPSDFDKIFLPFFTTKAKGTGLGLSSSYNTIKNMNGYLLCSSNYNTGTIFTILLPVLKKEVISDKSFLPKINVLIVDDDVDVLNSLSMSVESAGANVYKADNFWDALEIISKRFIDVAILDYMLGEQDGLDLYKSIKERSPKTKTIIISGYEKDNLKKDPDYNKRFFFLPKPFDSKKLINLIRFVYETIRID